LSSNTLNGKTIKLPGGQYIEAEPKRSNFYTTIYTFKKTQLIKTQMGKFQAKGITLHKDRYIYSIVLEKPQKIKSSVGMLIAKRTVVFFKNGSLSMVHLNNPTIIKTPAGNVKVNGTVYFHNNGKLSSCSLINPQFISSQYGRLKVRYTLGFHNNSTLLTCNLEEKKLIKTPVGIIKLNSIRFYKNGLMKGCFFWELPKKAPLVKTPIGNLRLNRYMTFSPRGNVTYCELASPQYIKTNLGKILIRGNLKFKNTGHPAASIKISGQQFIKTRYGKFLIKDKISLYNYRKIYMVHLAQSKKIRTHLGSIQIIKKIQFYPSGRLEFIICGENSKIKTTVGNLNADYIIFYKNNRIKTCKFKGTPLIRTSLGKMKIKWQIKFHSNRRIKELYLSKVKAVRTPSGKIKVSFLSFYSNERIKGCIPVSSFKVRGKEYKNRYIHWNYYGRFKGIDRSRGR